MRENRYIKVKEILEVPAGSSLPWKDVKTVFGKAKANPLITSSPAGSYINTFNTVLGVVDPILTVNKVLEKVRPIVTKVTQVVGAWSNPALIPELIQDVVSSVQKIVLDLVVKGVETAKDYILNVELDLGGLGKDTLDSLNSKISDASGSLNRTANSTIGAFDNSNTNLGNLDALNNCIESFLEKTKDATSTAVDTATTKEDLINKIKEEFGKTGTCLDPSDSLFAQIDDSIGRSKSQLASEITDSLSGIDIDISDIQSDNASDAAILNNLKNGFLDSLKNIIVGNNSELLNEFLGKNNSDIERLMRLLKEMVEKDIANKKYICLMKIRKAIENLTDMNEIKIVVQNILSSCPTDYNLSSILRDLLNNILKGFLNYKKSRKEKSDEANARSQELYDLAYNLFSNFYGELKSLIYSLINGLNVAPIELEDDQIIITDYDNFITDVFSNAESYIENLSTFNVSSIQSDNDDYIKNYSLLSYFNDAVYSSGTKTVCYKFTYLRGKLHTAVEEVLIKIKHEYKHKISINIPDYITEQEEIIEIMEFIDDFMDVYLVERSEKSIDVFIRNAVPCKNCITCSNLKLQILKKLENNIFLLKKFAMNRIDEALENATYDGTLEENKATAIAVLSEELKDTIEAKKSFYCNWESIYTSLCYAEEEKLINVLLVLILM